MIHNHLPQSIKNVLRDTVISDYYLSAERLIKRYEYISQLDSETWNQHKYTYLLEYGEFVERSFNTDIGEISVVLPEYANSWYTEVHEPGLTSELADVLSPDTVFYDVGSQFGYFIQLALQAGIEPSNIHAFEAKRNVWAHLLSENRNEDLNIINNVVSNKNRDEKVTIDSYARQENYPDVIKIDVEGAEGNVIHGMEEVLNSGDIVIYVEVHPTMISDFGYTVEDIYHILKKYKYDVQLSNHRNKNIEWVPIGDESQIQSYKGDTYLLRAIG